MEEDKLGYSKYYFMDDKYKEEWDTLDPQLKKSVTQHIEMYTRKMQQGVAIRTMSLVIEDLVKRIEGLESK